MSTIKSSSEDLTLNADGSNEVKFQINAVEKASINSSGLFTSTTIDATALTGNLPAISGASLTGITSNIKNGKMDLDLSTATGSLTVTGLGFTPTHLLVNFAISNTEIAGWGMMGNAGPYFVTAYDDFNDVYWRGGMEVRVSGSARQAVVLTSLDADGFTLGHTKHGSPTGTAWVMWMAFG